MSWRRCTQPRSLAAHQRGDAVEAERIQARLEAFSDLTDELFADARRIREAELAEAGVGRSEAADVRAEAAIEAREDRVAEAHARGVLFDDLQRSWSDVRYAVERDAHERLEEELGRMMEEEVVVVEAADRWAGLDLR